MKGFEWLKRPVVVRVERMKNEALARCFMGARSAPMLEGIREVIRRAEYEATERAAAAAVAQPEVALRHVLALDVLRELEKDLMGWVKAGEEVEG
jgi:hypothetical protein